MPEGLIDIIKQVLLSWQVIFIAIAFFLWRLILCAAVAPSKPKVAKKPKLKRPKEEPSLPKDIDTGDIGLGD